MLLIANKLDAVHRRAELAPWLQGMQERHAFAEFVPLSAKRKMPTCSACSASSSRTCREQPWFYEEDALTDRSERFLASEIIREKLFRLTGDELPYTSTVVIDKFEEEGDLRRIAASIVVERDAHKGMVIGDGGERLKRIGSEARQELETLMDAKVFLELWVKVRSGWADDEEHLRSLRLRVKPPARRGRRRTLGTRRRSSTAYVLHRYDWSETEPDPRPVHARAGPRAVAAKGAKRPYSQLRAVLLPFQRIHVALGRAPRRREARREVQTLRSAEWAGGARCSPARRCSAAST